MAITRLARSNHVPCLNAQILHWVLCSHLHIYPIGPSARNQGTFAPAMPAFRADRLHILIVPETKKTTGLMTVHHRADMVRITRRHRNILRNIHGPTNDVQNDLIRVSTAEIGPVVKNVTQDQGIHHRIDVISLLSVKMGRRAGNRKDQDMSDFHLIRLETESSKKGASKNGPSETIIWHLPGVPSQPIQKPRISIPKEQL